MELSEDTKQLQRSLFQSKIERAKLMTLDERLFAGAKLFDEQMKFTRDMIAGLNPDWNAAQVDAEVRRRLAIQRRLDNAGLYRPVVIDEATTQ